MSREGKRECRAEESARRRPRPGGREKVREGGRGPLSFLPSLPQFSSPCSQATHRRHSSPAPCLHRPFTGVESIRLWLRHGAKYATLRSLYRRASSATHVSSGRAHGLPAAIQPPPPLPSRGRGGFLEALGCPTGRMRSASPPGKRPPRHRVMRGGAWACLLVTQDFRADSRSQSHFFQSDCFMFKMFKLCSIC